MAELRQVVAQRVTEESDLLVRHLEDLGTHRVMLGLFLEAFQSAFFRVDLTGMCGAIENGGSNVRAMPHRKSTVRGREFGDGVRAALKQASLTSRAACELLGWDEGKLSDLVNGKGGSNEVDLAKLLGLCRTPPAEFDHLMSLSNETDVKDWLQPNETGIPDQARTLRDHEKLATDITGWHMNLVPGLLQTPDYTRAVGLASAIVPNEAVCELIELRTARRELVERRRQFTFYVHEQALRLPVGGHAVMSEQLHHLLRVSVRPYVDLRVVPTAIGAHAGLAGEFILLKFNKIEPIVYLESHGANVFLEDKPSIAIYEKVLASLGRAALDEEQSRRLITDIVT